jgi:peroxiredoxin
MKWRGLEESTAAGLSGKTLKQQLDERRQLAEHYTPSEVVALYQRAIDDIRALGLAERALKPGDHVAEFALPDENEKQVSSAALLAQGPLIMCFFRGRWCPFDVGQLEAMNGFLPQIRAAGASLVAISPQKPQQAFFMRDQHKLQFSLLCDAGNRVARQFGLVYPVPEYQQQVYRRSFVNLPFANGDDSWELPMPATYVVGRDGKIRFARIDVDYRERPEPLEILRVVSR